MKLLYKTKKWDNEMAAIGKVRKQIKATHHGMDSEELNIRNILWSFLDPESYPYRNPQPNLDEGSVLDMIASKFQSPIIKSRAISITAKKEVMKIFLFFATVFLSISLSS